MHMAAAGGRLDVIKFLQPLFGARVHNKTRNSYTILHWAVQGGHYEVARYSIESLKMNPQHRDKVCMGGGDVFQQCGMFGTILLYCGDRCWRTIGHTYVQYVLCLGASSLIAYKESPSLLSLCLHNSE